jgi:hypothetical protein
MQESQQMRKFRMRVSYFEDEIPFGPHKEIRNPDGQLHHETEFALITPTLCVQYKNGRRHGLQVTKFGTPIYFYEDRRVPPKFILDPEGLTIEEVLGHENGEIRYAGMNILGYDKFLEHEGVELIDEEIHEDDPTKNRKLYHVSKVLMNEYRIVEVLNSTPEPDGTHKRYFIPVPATDDCKTCHGAVAWTFGLTAQDYNPVHET